jgi:uncharacterized protein YjiS (DUF1127 family)
MSTIRTEHFSPRPIARAPGRAGATSIGPLAERTLQLLRKWQHRAHLREEGRRLCERDGRLLRDIGVTRSELLGAGHATSQPFWP